MEDSNKRKAAAGDGGNGCGDSSTHGGETRPPAPAHEEQGGLGISSNALEQRSSESAKSSESAIPSVDQPSSNVTETVSGPAPKVRFSEDIQRSPLPGSSRAVRPAGPNRASSLPGASPTRFTDGHERPNLALDTEQSTLRRTSLALHSSRDYLHGTLLTPIPSNATASLRLSPTSPSKRNRGYSLRRSLFTRGVQDQVDDQGRATELEEAFQLQDTGTSERVLGNDSKQRDGDKSTLHVDEQTVLPDAANPNQKAHATIALPNYEVWFQRQARRLSFIQTVRTSYQKTRKTILRINELPPSKDGRHIDLEAMRKKSLTDERSGRSYISNTIRSSRYTAWNFLPRQLFFQFSKLANFYFLSVSILQMIPSLSTTGTYTTIAPLLVFVSISMAKEGYDDLRRYRLDKVENNRKASVLHAYQPTASSVTDESQAVASPTGLKHWASTKWENVHVGDIIKLERDEPTPADIVLLHADGPNGVAYIETMALDGETNLKSKQAPPTLAERCVNEDQLAQCQAHFVVEDPNLDLYNFEGKVTVAGETRPLTNNEVVYRGSILRNTNTAYGMVIYTGEECKIRMNANKNPRIKAPALQAKVNRVVVIIVLFVLALAIFNTCAYRIWSHRTEDKSWYLTNARVAFFPIVASFIIMFNTLIPLSLYVSLEIVKLAQMILMNDVDMYDEASNTPMEPRTSTINEELGQVSYIFSDKTGTLTDNSMQFRKYTIAGIAWLHDCDLQRENAAEASQELTRQKKHKEKKRLKRRSILAASSEQRKSDVSKSSQPGMLQTSEEAVNESSRSKWRSSARPRLAQPELRSADLILYLQRNPRALFAKKARFFLLAMALCHTCLPEVQGDGTTDFQAASPDELALVRAAKELGFLVVERQAGTITLKISVGGTDEEPSYEVYEILDVIEFSSKRKRMSIIVRFPNRQICLFCKGADSTVMQLLRMSSLAAEKAVEVERRANKRKSLEAQEVIRRNSEQYSRGNSMSRPSMSMSRPSIGGVGRPSLNMGRLQPIRDEVDQWLTSREHDVDISSVDDESVYYTPRASTHMHRFSSSSEPRASLQTDVSEDIFDEGLILDDAFVFERCFQHINDFATEGLRTLLYGFRYLGEQEYTSWKKMYSDASTSLVDRQILIERAADTIERDLELAGATAIEDKLQRGVPEAIDKLRRANIKMWMLTGDKRETAINIGHSCRLIKDYSAVTILDHAVGQVDQHIAAALIDCNSGNIAHSVVVIDGLTLAQIEVSQTTMSLFLNLAVLVDTVICCRASPSQKASLVKSIRKTVKDSITLAVGDGANDIAMIQEAHVGIGITGKEGLQAARTSDYSIAQFRFLLKLLLVHGRWNYIRTCKYTLGTFWKEMLFYLTQALYQRCAGYTGTSLYESWSLSMFNTLFTSLPVIFMGVFEKDLAASTLLAVPELYNKGQRSAGFNIKVYLGWMFMASAESILIFFVMLGLYGQIAFTRDNSLFSMGVLTYSACVIMISIKMQLVEMHDKSIMTVVSFVLSVGGWFLWNMVLSAIYGDNPIYHVKHGFLYHFGRNALWWLVLILVVVSCVVFEYGVTSLRSAWFPTDVDVFQEYEQDPEIRRRFEDAASSELQQGRVQAAAAADRDKATDLSRETEVQELLDRPRVMEEGRSTSHVFRRRSVGTGTGEADSPAADGGVERRRSVEIQEMLARRFGSIKK